MVPMHAEKKRKEALHEPQGRAGCPQPAEPRRGEDTAPYQLAWFMVPMHAEKKRKEALHEAYKSRARACVESGGGPPHSKTLARWQQSLELPPGFGVRQSSGALAKQASQPKAQQD